MVLKPLWRAIPATLAILHLVLMRISYLPSRDIVQTSICRFLPFFFCCYLLSKWNIYFIILVFFRSSSFLSLSFPALYSTLPFFAYTSLSVSPSVCLFVCLPSTFFSCCVYLSSLTFFFYHLLWKYLPQFPWQKITGRREQSPRIVRYYENLSMQ